jgi:hypothetical protein
MTTNSIGSLGLFAAVFGCAFLASEIVAQAQVDKFAGVWNYDLPGASAGVNFGTIRCPATFKGKAEFVMTVPQVGTLTLNRKEDGQLEGQTDQACTWTFKGNGSAAELNPTPQSCFNKVIGSSYTITRWSFRVDGNRQTESIEAKSHLPMGDCDLTLNGSRTRADEADSSGLFVGAWEYDAPNPRTHSNMLQFMQPGEGDRPNRDTPQTGAVSFSKAGDHTLTARTPDGCSWLLDVHGNTALLPAAQTCEIAGSAITMNHWTIASDGQTQRSVMNMTQNTGGKNRTALLSNGRLTKQTSQ